MPAASLPPTWVEGAAGGLHDVDNLPYAVFSSGADEPRVGVRIGDLLIDLAPLAATDMLEHGAVFGAGAQAPMSVPRGPANVIGVVACSAQRAAPLRPRARERLPLRATDVLRGGLAGPRRRAWAIAALPLTPSSPSRRTASRRVMMPSAWSSATSSARYRCSSVMGLLR